MIGIGTRIRKSPYYESNLKYGVTGFTVYNKMYLPTAFSGPEKEYESLINDVTFGDFAAERQIEINGKDAYDFVRYITPRNLEKCEIGWWTFEELMTSYTNITQYQIFDDRFRKLFINNIKKIGEKIEECRKK